MALPFAETVLLWRVHRGLTQEQLARAAGITRANLSAIERGEREVTLKTLRALAAALEVRPGALVDGVAPGPEPTDLSRATLERIADAVVSGGCVSGAYEEALMEDLRQVLAPAHTSTARPRRGVRARDRAYLRLKASAPRDVVETLLARVSDRLRTT